MRVRILWEETEKIRYPNDRHILERLESKQVAVAGDDEVGGGLKRAFQDPVIRNVLKDHDPDRRLHDRRSASDELEGGRDVFFTLMKLGSEDACGLGQDWNGRKERRVLALSVEKGILREAA